MALTTNLAKSGLLNKETSPAKEDKLSFKEFYSSGISLKQLKEGKYPCKLLSHEFVTQIKEGGQVYEFVKLSLQLEDRVLVDNRFEQGFGIMLSQVKAQFGLQDQAVPVADILDKMMREEFHIWIEYTDGTDKTYRNVQYAEPVKKNKGPEIVKF